MILTGPFSCFLQPVAWQPARLLGEISGSYQPMHTRETGDGVEGDVYRYGTPFRSEAVNARWNAMERCFAENCLRWLTG